jgi:hypothetical protein
MMILSLCHIAEAATKNTKVTVIDAKYEELVVLSSMYEDDTDGEVPLLSFKKGEKYGIINEKGEIIADPVYDYIWDYYEGSVIVIKDDKVGYVDNTGKQIVECKYDLYPCESFHEGLALVHKDGKYGFIDKTGKEIIPLQYEDALNFTDGVAPVCSDGKWGLIDKTGKEILAPTYAQIGYVGEGSGIMVSFRGGMAQVKTPDGKWGYIDITGKEVVKPRYDEAYDYRDGFAPFEHDGLMGLATKSGVVLEPTYDYIFDFGDQDVMFFVKNKKLGLINRDMKVLMNPRYDSAKEITPEGYITVRKGNKYGFINTLGKELIKPQYEYAGSFANGLAPVMINGKIGYINTKNKLVISTKYEMKEELDPEFTFGSAIVIKDGKYGIIDQKGNYIAKLQYEDIIKDSANELYYVKLKEKYGVLDKKGNVILKASYDYIYAEQNILIVKNGKLSELYGLDGKKLVAGSYQKLSAYSYISEKCQVLLYEKMGNMGALVFK